MMVSTPETASRSASPSPSAVTSRTSVPVPPVTDIPASISAPVTLTVRPTLAELAISLFSEAVPAAIDTIVSGVQDLPAAAPPNVRI